MLPPLYYYICAFIFGAAVGSFLNVCIYRIPLKEDIVKEPSHCMTCGHKLAWYDNIPLLAWIALRGRCRYCGTKLSAQYPAIELLNAVLWTFTVVMNGINIISLIQCLIISALIVLSVIDWRTYEIPFGINVFIFICGAAVTVCSAAGIGGATGAKTGMAAVISHIAGMLIISVPLLILFMLSGGRAIGGGDVKLFFAAGLALGASSTIVAFFISFLLAAVIHIARMKLAGAESRLAMGPYIAAGVCISIWFGQQIVDKYMAMMF